jgi:excisionase family DNA binding protein
MAKNKLLSTAMAAAKLGFSADYVRRLCGDGKIKATKLSSDWLIDEKDIRDIKRQRKIRETEHGERERST